MPKIDFSVTPPLIDTEYAGEKQEIDAVSLEIIPEKSMTDDTSLIAYAIYFGTPNGLESSRTFSRGEQIKVDLWSDLTESEVLECQLIATNSDGSKISKSPIVRFVLGESLEGELVGADDRHDSLLAQIADLELKKHWHENKSVLDRFGVSSGKPTFDGVEIGGSGGIEIYDSSTGKCKFTLDELATLNNNKVPMMYQSHPLTVFIAAYNLFRAFYINPVYSSSSPVVRKFDVHSDKTFFWYADLPLATDEDIQAEATARANKDTQLEGRIDAIVARSDVRDVVATYADLEDYDTSTLGDNDVIKVLKDETQDDARTYYRWHTADEEFTYVGAEETYYTKEEIDMMTHAEIFDTTDGQGNMLSKYTAAELYQFYQQKRFFSFQNAPIETGYVSNTRFYGLYWDNVYHQVNRIMIDHYTEGNEKIITLETVSQGVTSQVGQDIRFYISGGKLYFEEIN